MAKHNCSTHACRCLLSTHSTPAKLQESAYAPYLFPPAKHLRLQSDIVFVPAGSRATTTGIGHTPLGETSEHCPANPAAFPDATGSARVPDALQVRCSLLHFMAALRRALPGHHFTGPIHHFDPELPPLAPVAMATRPVKSMPMSVSLSCW